MAKEVVASVNAPSHAFLAQDLDDMDGVDGSFSSVCSRVRDGAKGGARRQAAPRGVRRDVALMARGECVLASES